MKYLKMLLMVPQNLPCNDASVREKIVIPETHFLLTVKLVEAPTGWAGVDPAEQRVGGSGVRVRSWEAPTGM